MIRSTSYVDLVPGTTAETVDRLLEALVGVAAHPGVLAAEAARAVPLAHPGGDLMVLCAFADDDARRAVARHPYVADVVRPLLSQHAAHVETAHYRQGPVRLREPGLRSALHRTLLLRVDPAAGPGDVEALEHALADMPRYIDAIRNSSLSRVDRVTAPRGPVWTHVWEQEFRDLDGLTGPYMRHPYHWSYVDTWFDPQSPNHLVGRPLVHSACPVRSSILALAPPA